MFSDNGHGGKEGARRAARKFKRSAMGDLPARVFRGPVLTAKAKKTGAVKKAPAKAKPKKKTRR